MEISNQHKKKITSANSNIGEMHRKIHEAGHGGRTPITNRQQQRASAKQKTNIKGAGKVSKETSLYMSRTSPLVRTGSTPVSLTSVVAMTESSTPIENAIPDEKLGIRNACRKPPVTCIQREFTFTGYDIMSDIEPKKEVKESANQKVERENVECYLTACKRLRVPPSSFISRHINDKDLVMKSHPLGPKGVRALCVALVDNHRVQMLNLEDNDIGSEGAECIAEMLEENDNITELNISGNLIGSRGIEAFTNLLKRGRNLHKLDISGSGLEDSEAKVLADMIEAKSKLEELNVSHNGISEIGALDIGRAIAKNDILKDLDMSWNHIRGNGALAIALGIKKNVGLKYLNLAWNGFGNVGAENLGRALMNNRTLLSLDISNNRIGIDGVKGLVKGLQRNEGLRSIKMGQNPYTAEVAMTILRAIENSDKCVLTMLDISDIVVRSEFLDKWDEVKRTRQLPLRIVFGPVMQSTAPPIIDEEVIDWRDPVMRMFKFMHDKGYRIIDLLKRLDKDRSLSVDRQEFKMGLVAEKIPMTEHQLDEVIKQLDTDKDGEVDMGELMRGEKEFRKKMKARMRKMLTTMKPDTAMMKLMEINEL
ncbi:leucine-rich repeat-containing protein 74B-like [Mercenaria mercenaria]|uniref:leucine-rich repeat-containing protein 74B-like n=1 Tax=Mercenaria mercenaria TaxID=6596 RepID=UPI00234F27C5|nr:leucine-rich repeat-containing protein 74B-like [Mercenaria mercenaria]